MKNCFIVLILMVCLFGQIDLGCVLENSTVKTTNEGIGKTLSVVETYWEGLIEQISVNLDYKNVILSIFSCKNSIKYLCIEYYSDAMENIPAFKNLTKGQDENLDKTAILFSDIITINYVERIPKGIFSNHTFATFNINKKHSSFKNINQIQNIFSPSPKNIITSIINILHPHIAQSHFMKLQRQEKVFCFNQLISSKIDEGKYDKTNTSKLIG